MLLLASTTAKYAQSNHNDSIPNITDIRMALQECGVLAPGDGAGEEGWEELLRKPVEVMGREVVAGGRGRITAEKRKREEGDVEDVRAFTRWFDGKTYAEIKRVAGMTGDSATGAAGTGTVGVGGGRVQVEDFLTQLKKRQARGGDIDGDARLAGTVLGREVEEGKGLVIEGGPVHGLSEWEERVREMARSGGRDGVGNAAPATAG
jgi:transcription initiation factor TFIID subunit 3